MASSRSSLSHMAFVIPCLAVMLLVGAYPVLSSIYLSMTNLSALRPQPEFVGLQNYAIVLSDSNFWNSVGVTIFYVLATVSAQFIVGLFLTLLLFNEIKGRRFFESFVSIPIAIPPIVIGVLFSPTAFLDDVNTLLYYGLCIEPLCSGNTGIFLDATQPQVYYAMMVAAEAFIWSPLFMIVMLAILKAVPKEIFEASEVSGANPWHKFRYIILPSLLGSPVLGAIVALRAIDSFRAFEIPYAYSFWLGQERIGTPVDTFGVLMFKMFTYAVYEFPLSQIAVIALLLLAVSLVSALAILRLLSRGLSGE